MIQVIVFITIIIAIFIVCYVFNRNIPICNKCDIAMNLKETKIINYYSFILLKEYWECPICGRYKIILKVK